MKIKHLLSKLIKGIGSTFNKVGHAIKLIFAPVGKVVMPVLRPIGKAIKRVVSLIVLGISKLWKWFAHIPPVKDILNNKSKGIISKIISLIFLGIKWIFICIGWVLHYVFLPITYPLSLFWKWFSAISVVRRVLDSKTMSFIKAFLSIFVWGIGQLFNGQKLKAFLFFIIFVGFVTIELASSNYFVETDAYDKLPGVNFGDDYIQSIMGDFYDANTGNLRINYPAFEDYLEEIDKSGNNIFTLTEDEFITFVAQDLRENNPIAYTYLDSETTYMDMNSSNRGYLFDQTYYYDDANDLFYQERMVDDNTKEYVNINLATNVLNEFNTIDDISTLKEVVFGHEITQTIEAGMHYYLDAKIDGSDSYIDLVSFNTAMSITKVESTHIIRSQQMFVDANGIYYTARDVLGTNAKIYVETDILTGITNEDNTLIEKEGLIEFNKNNTVYQVTDGSKISYFMEAETKDIDDNDIVVYINVKTGEVINSLIGTAIKLELTGPLYVISDQVYEYYEPGLIYLNKPIEFESTIFSDKLRQVMNVTYNQAWNEYTDNDYLRFMIKVYFEIYPVEKDNFITAFDNFYYDKAGLFVKSYWSVLTLGTSHSVDINEYLSLKTALIGNNENTPKVSVSVLSQVPILGHVSAQILIEGLIGIITSIIFFIFMIWSVRDTYKVSEAIRKKKIVLSDTKYLSETFEKGFAYFVLSPAMVVLGYISLMPIAFGFIIAFTSIAGDESLIATFDYIGFKNFVNLFDFTGTLGATFGRAFWRVLGWTIVWAIFSTITVFFGGFFQAIVLNSEKVVFRKFWRTILILPWAIPALLSQMIFKVMFAETGYVNQVLSQVGIYDLLTKWGWIGQQFDSLSGIQKIFYLGNQNIQWFTNPNNPTFVRIVLIVVNIWLGFPYFMALMTGVMTSIDKTLYEAADIDGASNGQKLWKITMPLVLYSTAPILIMTFSGNFNNFGVIYFITGGGPNAGNFDKGFAGDTDILISWMYKLTVQESIYNMASVFSVLIFFFVGSVTAWNLSRTRAFTED